MDVLIIGAGGVASYLLPVLLRTFREDKFIVMDGDTLEERNLDRQQFSTDYIGENKAEALTKTQMSAMTDFIPRFFRGSAHELGDYAKTIFYIICVADNHEARKNALALADDLGKPVFIAANELFDSEAYVYLPQWKGTPRDPRVLFPNILTDTTGSPLHCQEQQEASPQLALANFAGAAKLACMVWRWIEKSDKDNKVHFVHENIYEVVCT